MSTGSTKSSRKKQSRSAGRKASANTAAVMPEATNSEITERWWLVGGVSVMTVAAILRLYDLALVPFHHDEGVNGNFLVHLVRDGFWHYDPENYHGPSLYYLSAVIPWVIRFLFGVSAQNSYGLTTFNVRLVTVLFGLGTVWLVLMLRRRLGSVASLAGAALLAVSPGAVYLSRYFIHESLFVFFTLGIIVALLNYYDDGHPIYLLLAFASAALLFATKETWIISVGVLIIAFASTHVYRWLWRKMGFEAETQDTGPYRGWLTATTQRLGGPVKIALSLAGAIALAVVIGVSFYSSFFTNWKGVSDSLKTFQVWSRTGQQAHVHAWWTYFQWLWEEEAGLLILGTLGALAVVFKPKNSLALFCALWAFGIIAAYSLVPYKTPWLGLNFIVPLAIIGGYAFQVLYESLGRELSRLVIVAAVLALGLALYQTIVLNFFKYDDDHYTYVYAHTRREMLDMVADIEKVATQSGTGFDTGISIVSPDYWPLPWYFRNYKRVGYYGRVSTSNEPIIIASESQLVDIQTAFGDRYRQVNSKFPLRPGVDLVLFVRKDIAAP